MTRPGGSTGWLQHPGRRTVTVGPRAHPGEPGSKLLGGGDSRSGRHEGAHARCPRRQGVPTCPADGCGDPRGQVVVPLSDHEQRILAELEESLVRQDPEFAERVRSETVYRHAGRYCKWAAVTFVLGVVILVAFYSKSVDRRVRRRRDHVRLGGLVRAQPAPHGPSGLARPDPLEGRRVEIGRCGERDRERGERRPRLVPHTLPPARGLIPAHRFAGPARPAQRMPQFGPVPG